MHFNLTSLDVPARAVLHELSGQGETAATRLTVRRLEQAVRVTVEADDPDMLSLIASISPPGTDGFLYEEDCVQLALARPGDGEPHTLLLINPYGTRAGCKEALDWPVATTRRADGWTISIDVPLDGEACIGLSLHRFFRGVHHEVHSLTGDVPHPLDLTRFVPAVLQADQTSPEQIAANFTAATRRAVQAALDARLATVRRQLADHATPDGRGVDLDRAIETARDRARQPVRANLSFLCWNEGHFQHALADLWQLTGDAGWIELALERMEQVWALRADHLGTVDAMWQAVRPTWYDAQTHAICLGTGVVLHPIARVMRLIHQDPRLAPWRGRIERWGDWCRQSIAAHDQEWMDLPGGQGMYLEPYVKGPRRIYPRGGSRICPLNRAFFLAMPLLDLGRILDEPTYLDRATRMARFYRAHCERTEQGGLVWEYEVSRYPSLGEDLAHAAVQVNFARQCAAEGVVWTEADVKAIAVTLEQHVFRHGDVPCGHMRGYQPGLDRAVAAWAPLCRHAPHLLPRIAAVLEASLAQADPKRRVEGWSCRLLTRLALGRVPRDHPAAR